MPKKPSTTGRAGQLDDLADILGFEPALFNVTLFPNVGAESQEFRSLTTAEVAQLVAQPQPVDWSADKDTRAERKKRLPMIKLARFGDARTEKGSFRSDDNLQAVTGCEVDFDEGEMTAAEAAERLRAAQIAAVVYTSTSHSPDAPRWRVLCPASRELPVARRSAFVAHVIEVLGVGVDACSDQKSTSFFFGEMRGQHPTEVHQIEGFAIDLVAPAQADLADDLAELLGEIESDNQSPVGLSEAELRELLEVYPAEGLGYWEWWDVGVALHHETGGSDLGFRLWDEWSKASTKNKDKEQRDEWRNFNRKKYRPGKKLKTIRSIMKLAGWHRDILDGWEDELEDLGEAPLVPVGQGAVMRSEKSGAPLATLHNAILYLIAANRQRGLQIRFNEFTGRDEWVSGLIGDADGALIRVAIEQAGLRNVGSELTAQAIRAVARLNSYHPVTEWLGSLPTHDGTPRLDTWLSRYLGAADNAYSRAAGGAFLISMVARVLRPGCKADHVLVLGGAQGIGKSTACRILGGEWTGDNLPSIRDGSREAALYLRGHWLVEMAELSPSRKSEAEDLKSFLSRNEDETRAPYARRADVVPRQCVIVGTTNETEFLRDMTGGRRFWPIECGDVIDLEGLKRDRAQLFAEALAAFNAGEPWHLKPEVETLAAEAQETAREEHPWESEIKAILDGGDDIEMKPRSEVTVPEVLRLLNISTERQTTPQTKIVAGILKRMGWQRKVTKRGKLWVRP